MVFAELARTESSGSAARSAGGRKPGPNARSFKTISILGNTRSRIGESGQTRNALEKSPKPPDLRKKFTSGKDNDI
jgi:hypothetical protein